MTEKCVGKPNAIIADTNVYIHDPNAINFLREGGNTLFIPMVVIFELDNLKTKPDIGLDAHEALKRIEKATNGKDNSIEIIRNPTFNDIKFLDKKTVDHVIIATAYEIKKKRGKDFKEVKLVTRDKTVRIIARNMHIHTDDYYRETTKNFDSHLSIRTIRVKDSEISDDKQGIYYFSFPYDEGNEEHKGLLENSGIICKLEYSGEGKTWMPDWKGIFPAIKKGDKFRVIPKDINALCIKPYSINGNGPNWPQHIALAQLLDPEISLVFLEGGAGTGKTLLALAAAFERKKNFRQIYVTRPMIHLGDEDNMGYLPGNKDEKMQPWLAPIKQTLSFLKETGDGKNNKIIEQLENPASSKIVYEPLDYIRGMSLNHILLIVDEAQNLTPHQVKTIITRAGEHSTIFFTGDLDQIDRDRRRLDRETSGLAYAINRLADSPMVATTIFQDTVRSPLACLAEKLL